MNYNKKIIISLGILFFTILLSISILKISINILYPVNELSKSLKDSFKDIFGKAIKFDSMHFKYNGDIVLQNFYLSNTTDFNDNINLIKCREIIIDTSLIDLIRKKVTFAGVFMKEPEITIAKNYGKSYYNIFIEELTGGMNRDKIREFIKDGFRLELTESALSFRETYRNSKSSLELYNMDFKLKYKHESIMYKSYGYIEDKIRNGWFTKSSYRVIGEVFLNKNYSETEIKLKNFDLTHLNNIINEHLTFRTLVTGTFSGELNIIKDNGIIKCDGGSGISSVNLFYYDMDKPYQLFKNKNFDTDFKFTLSEKMDKLVIDKLELDDGTIELSSSFEYTENDFVSLQIKSNKINLSELSESTYLFNNCNYNGEMSFNGNCLYSLKEKKPENFNFNITVNRFNINPINGKNQDLTNIKDTNIMMSADKDKISIKSSFVSGTSDFDISFNSLIKSWNPVISSNTIEILSKSIDLDFLKEACMNTIKKVYNLAYIDMFQNFDEQRNFLKEPEGIFINNNDLVLKLHAEKLFIAGKSHLNNLNLDMSLVKGVVKTNSFTLEGYSGIYSFNLYSSLRQEYPFFKFDAEAKDIDLSGISGDSGLSYSFGGIFSLEMNFETSAFRLGQIVENGRAGFSININNGYVLDTPLQKRLNDFLVKNNYKDILSSRFDFSDFSFSLTQSANNFYIKNLKLNSANMNFNAYGIFSEEEGLKVPVNLNMLTESVFERVPLEATGSLEAPCISIKSKNKTESLCF